MLANKVKVYNDDAFYVSQRIFTTCLGIMLGLVIMLVSYFL